MTRLELSSALRCDPSPLRRLMRVLVHLKIFKEETLIQHLRQYMERMSYAVANPDHSKLINEGMACNARVVVPAVIESCLEVFKGIETIVDVDGGDGTTLRLLVQACPWIRGINFDLPLVLSVAQECDRIENVGGDMFDCIPKADAVIINCKRSCSSTWIEAELL
ncbi:hypothetical protein CerSpe_286650 [Prunus speciosa]